MTGASGDGARDGGDGAVPAISEGSGSPEYFSDTPVKYRGSNLVTIDYWHGHWPAGSVITRCPPGSVTC